MNRINDNGRRFLSWNLTNLRNGGNSARPCCLQCSNVPTVGVSFVHATKCTRALRDLSRFSRDVEGLWSYITANEGPYLYRGILTVIFCDKSGRIEPDVSEESKDLFLKKLGYLYDYTE